MTDVEEVLPKEPDRSEVVDQEAIDEEETLVLLSKQLRRLPVPAQKRVLLYLCARFEVSEVLQAGTPHSLHGPGHRPTASAAISSAGHPAAPVNAKQFLAEKNPISDTERITVLAQVLVDQGTTRFDSALLQQANWDAAGHKFNVIEAGKSAVKRGFLASAGEGKRQITALGEQVVQALPDRDRVAELLVTSGKRQSPARRRSSARRPKV